MCAWARRDRRVLGDWEVTVNDCIEEKVGFLNQQHVNQRRKHALRDSVQCTK